MKKTFFLFSLFLFLTSCFSGGISGGGNMTEERDTEAEKTEMKTEERTFVKDEQGYYILPSDFLKEGKKEEGKMDSVVSYADAVEGMAFEEYRVYLNQRKVTPYRVKVDTSHTFKAIGNAREDNAVLSLRLAGYVKVTIQLKHPIYRDPVIRPLSSAIGLELDKEYRTISFYIHESGQYTLEFNDYMTKTLHLFVDDYREGEEKIYQNDSSVLYFAKGIHDHGNDNRIPVDNTVRLTEQKKIVYLEEGAVVRASFFAYSLENVKILGHGIIDGSVFTRNATTNERQIPIDFQYCRNVTIQDVIFLDPAGWCLNLYFLDKALVDNVKIITSRANGDGISVQSSKNVEVKNSFVRTFDDTLVVKNYPKYGNYSQEGATENIYFHDCILITDLAQSMEVGYETIGEVMKDIRFEDITILHAYHHAVFSIHNANNASINAVSYKNITVEDADMGQGDGNGKLLEFNVKHSSIWSDNWKTTKLGSVSSVTMENIKVTGKEGVMLIEGSLDERDHTTHRVSGVKITDFSLNGTKANAASFSVGSYVDDFSVNTTENEATGASSVSKTTLEEVASRYSSFVEFVS